MFQSIAPTSTNDRQYYRWNPIKLFAFLHTSLSLRLISWECLEINVWFELLTGVVTKVLVHDVVNSLENKQMFWKEKSSPASWWNNKSRKKPEWKHVAKRVYFMLVYCSDFTFTWRCGWNIAPKSWLLTDVTASYRRARTRLHSIFGTELLEHTSFCIIQSAVRSVNYW
jgi:hypothetical protein